MTTDRPLQNLAEMFESLRQWTATKQTDLSAMDHGWFDHVEDEINAAYLEFSQLRRRHARLQKTIETKPVTISTLIARALKYMREECGRTQADLALNMNRLGFVTWKRITVAETESGKRRPTWEELIGLCALFGTQLQNVIGALMFTETVELNERRFMTAEEYAAIIGIDAGDELYDWYSFDIEVAERAGQSIADIDDHDEDWRPIAEYHRRMRQAEIAHWKGQHPAALREDETS